MTFKLAPNTTMVLGKDDPVGGIERAAELGFPAIECFDLTETDPGAVRRACERHDVEIAATLPNGVAANTGASGPSVTDPSCHEEAVQDLERGLSTATEYGARGLILTVGPERHTLPPGTEHRAIVNVLQDVAPAAEAAGVTVLLEPLNTRVDHPGYYLNSSYEAYEIVDAVDSPRIKVLYDIYHQQIMEGNLIENLTQHLDLIGHLHVAAVPGRHEPGTGELAYERLFETLATLEYDGFVGLEYNPSRAPAETLVTVRAMVPESAREKR